MAAQSWIEVEPVVPLANLQPIINRNRLAAGLCTPLDP